MEKLIDQVVIAKYDSFKDSGVPWLMEVPRHWEIQKGKWLFLKAERKAKKEDGIITCFRDGQVTLRTNRKTEGFTIALKEHGYQGIRKGDLVIHNMDAFAGAIGVSDSDGKSTPVYSVCIPRKYNEVNPYYYAYFLQNLAKNRFIESLAKGIRERSTDFRFNDFGLLLLSKPPFSEQAAIASFLDRKTALIDKAISIKEKQIELLKERKQVLIYKAVTRGLKPNVKMKDSGVEWIGEIPEHWEVLPGFRVFKENKSKNAGKADHNVLSLSYGNIVIKPKEKLTGLVPESFETYQIVKPGDIIIRCMDLQNDKNSLRTGIAQNHGIITSAYLNLNIINGNVPDYIYNFLHALDTAKVLYKFGTGLRQNLSYTDFKRLPILVPPIYEQKSIIEFIESVKTKIATIIFLKQEEIEKLKEYKSTLINSAVTGKIKVC
jgi:type I restriction enzyme S subunit